MNLLQQIKKWLGINSKPLNNCQTTLKPIEVIKEVQVGVETQSIQLFITKGMRNELANLGWKKHQVDAMSPSLAHEIVKNNMSAN